jgi:hypothetical protein
MFPRKISTFDLSTFTQHVGVCVFQFASVLWLLYAWKLEAMVPYTPVHLSAPVPGVLNPNVMAIVYMSMSD